MSRPKIDRTGEVGVSRYGEKMTIVRYGGKADIDVQFQDGTVVEHKRYDHFKEGKIKNPMTPSVWGVGFIGIGKFKPCDENGKITKCYYTWMHMLERCYSSKYHEKEPMYKGCKVDEKWHNFQVFAQWFYEHYYEIENERMALDKDVLHKGNKFYSADTCVFVPQSINNLFTKRDKLRGELPIGVRKHGNKFQAQLTKDNKVIALGTYPTPNEAFLAYKIAKEEYIKEVAEEYKDKIPYRLYEALMNYEVEIDD